MQIGDLPRARAARRPASGILLPAVGALLVMSLLAGGWWALSPFRNDHDSGSQVTIASDERPGTGEPEGASLSDLNPPMQVTGTAAAETPLPYDGTSPSTSTTEPNLDAGHLNTASGNGTYPEPDLSEAAAGSSPSSGQEEASLAPLPPAVLNETGTLSDDADPAEDPGQTSEVVDLNTGRLEDLNELRGGGTIGSAIVKGRPYASVEDLVTKKVLRRSVYEQIKDQVTVR
jgi:hypothetical protein